MTASALLAISPDQPAWPAFRSALEAAALPTEDLEEPGQTFFSCEAAAAFGGFYRAGEDALLRSIVVRPSARGAGAGRQITTAILAHLAGLGVVRAWLLTTNASGFFAALGFQETARELAPRAIAATPEFSSLCPQSAVLMCKRLTR